MSTFNREFNWIMKDVSFFDLEGETFEIFSPEFNLNNTKFMIRLYCDNVYSLQCAHLALCESLELNEVLTLDMEMEISNSNNKVIYVTEKKKGVQFGPEEIIPCFPIPLLEQRKKIKNSLEDLLILRLRVVATSNCAATYFPLNSSCTIQTSECLEVLSYTRRVDYSKDLQLSENLRFPVYEGIELKVNIENHYDDIIFKISESVFYRKTLKCEIIELHNAGEEKLSCYDYFTFTEISEIWNFPNFLKRSLLKNPDVLILKFTFTYATGGTLVEHVDGMEPQNALTDDFRRMLFRKDLSDVRFCIDNEVICAHKCILAARSPVFSAMFQHEMVESQTGVIDITDMDMQTLKLLLEFMYTGDLSEYNWKIMLELLLAAVKYQIPSLSPKCSKFLKLRLSPDNICDVISVADMVGEQVLKSAAMKYIKDNVFDVLSSHKWCMFIEKNSKLCSEIFIMLSDDLKTKHINN